MSLVEFVDESKRNEKTRLVQSKNVIIYVKKSFGPLRRCPNIFNVDIAMWRDLVGNF